MKTSARIVLILLAGLIVAGCASQSAQSKPSLETRIASSDERLMSSRDYWMLRDLEIRSDRARSQP